MEKLLVLTYLILGLVWFSFEIKRVCKKYFHKERRFDFIFIVAMTWIGIAVWPFMWLMATAEEQKDAKEGYAT